MTLDNILEEIKKANSIVILTHQSPDGDAIGSSLAFYIALKQMGKNPDLIVNEMPRVFKFLPYAGEIKTEKTKDAKKVLYYILHSNCLDGAKNLKSDFASKIKNAYTDPFYGIAKYKKVEDKLLVAKFLDKVELSNKRNKMPRAICP